MLAKDANKVATPPTRINKYVAQYIAIRDKIKQVEARHERELEPIKQAKAKLAGLMLEFLDQTGQESARTIEGTVYVSLRETAALADPEAFMAYVMENGAFELMDRRANSTACRDFAEEHGSLPPGVKINAVRSVGVRTS